ncbi:hypothetical protein FGO68_gene684 [Halteria grandinella]|uniref:Uncharacterized protein n=1 Tax=Halteria grandinella TaxID=5974 RepID=A0A8J8NMS6_HALGN|nr:hypothetical protein FGO68_gene684 [Halteria grandinella]
MVESHITRKTEKKLYIPGVRMLSDFKDIVRIGGWRGLFRGGTPYLIWQVINQVEINYEPPTIMLFKAEAIFSSLILFLDSPLIIQFSRMQNLDYPRQSHFVQGFTRMIATEGLSTQYRGFPGYLIGRCLQLYFAWVSIKVLPLCSDKIIPLSFLMAGQVISHPFLLLSQRVMNAPFFSTFMYTWKIQGFRGFYRGFAPSTVAYLSIFAPYLLREIAIGSYKDECRGLKLIR